MTLRKIDLNDHKYELILSSIVLAVSLIVLRLNHLYPVELIFSFAPHIAVGLVLGMFLFIWHKSYFLATACALGAFCFSVSLEGKLDYRQPQVMAGQQFKVAHFNVLALNDKYEALAQAAIDTNADVLSFQEFTLDWEKALNDRLKDYPHRLLLPDDGTGGLAIYSKLPLRNPQFLCVGGNDNLVATVDIPQGEVTILATHTKAPVTYSHFKNRNEHLAQLADMIPQNRPLLLVGDLNIVPWSQHFISLTQTAGLRDSRSGFSSTYPAGGGFLQIPIDYILHNDHLACTGFKVISATGSDHKGVVGEYFVRRGRG